MNDYDKYENGALQAPEDNESGEIDFGDILRKLVAHWKIIAIVTCIFGAIGIYKALTMTREWGVSVTLAPEVGGRTVSSVSSMLGLGDISLGSNSDAMRVTVFPEICRSTPFLARLLKVKVAPYVSPKALAEGVTVVPITVLDHLKGVDKPKHKKNYSEKKAEYEQYYDDNVIDISNLTPNQSSAIGYLKQNVSASLSNKTGIATIRVVMDEPRMATMLADTVCVLLQQYVSDYHTQKAKANYEYYALLADEARDRLVKAQSAYAAAVDYDRSVILQSVNSEKERLQNEVNVALQVYSQMSQQREMAKAKIQEEKPVYAVIQPATMPRRPMNSRKKVVLVWGFIGFLFACAGVVFVPEIKKFWASVRTEN